MAVHDVLGTAAANRSARSRKRRTGTPPANGPPVEELVRLLPVAIYMTDSEGRITHYNEAAAAFWGFRPDLGTSWWFGSRRLYWPDGSPIQHRERPMAVAIRERRAIAGAEAVSERPDGTRVPFLAYPTPFYDAAGNFLGAVNMMVDISDRKRLDEERAQHIREIEALNARLQRAMAETHHRVKNNLQIIAAMIDMMAMRGGPAVTTDDLRSLGAHVRVLATIHAILTQEAKKDGQAEFVSIQDVISGLVALLGHSWGEPDIEIDVDDIEFPIKMATSLALVTNELVLNAIKYGRRDIRVGFRVESEVAVLEVSDGGPGFPPGFDPETLETTGIDLVRNLIRWDLAGKMDFRNAESGGAVVTVQLPLPLSRSG